jgi:hypothetical protein
MEEWKTRLVERGFPDRSFELSLGRGREMKLSSLPHPAL